MFKVRPLPRTLPAALRDVTSAKPQVRISAIGELAGLAQGEARAAVLEALARALAGDADPRVRAQAAVALADAGGGEHTVGLIAAADDPHPWVRQMAILALGEVADGGDRQALGVIERALRDDVPAMRFQALIALCRTQHEAALGETIRQLCDGDDQVRYIALRLAEEQWVDREEAGPPTTTELARVRQALDDPSPKVRVAAAILLARLGDRSGTAQIVAAVNDGVGAEEAEDSQSVVELAGSLGLEAARAGLARRAWGWFGLIPGKSAFQALVSLAKLRDARAIRSIVRDLSASSRDTRTLAVVAAGRAGLTETLPRLRAMRGDELRADPLAVEEALQALQSHQR